MVVIGLALLGAAGLQTFSLKATQSGKLRSQAIVLSWNLIERIEANNGVAVAGGYAATISAQPRSFFDCRAGPCTAQQLADFDLASFREQLLRVIPGATATITFNNTTPVEYTIRIAWTERSIRGTNTHGEPSETVEPKSFSTTRKLVARSVAI